MSRLYLGVYIETTNQKKKEIKEGKMGREEREGKVCNYILISKIK